jgi:hypothetical protein
MITVIGELQAAGRRMAVVAAGEEEEEGVSGKFLINRN